MRRHLIFFDDECPLCHQAVRHILEVDRHGYFFFAPLRGETAKEILTGPQKPLLRANSLVLVENYDSTSRKFWIRSQAIFRIYWLAESGWGLLGLLSFLPPFLGDLLYKKVAQHRHQFKFKIPDKPVPESRLLP